MTRALAIYAIAAATVLLAAAMLAIFALIARDGGPEDGWEAGHLEDLDGMLHERGPADYDPAEYDDQLESDLQAEAEEYDQRLHLAGDWADQLTPPEVPQLDPCNARPYVLYTPRHADDTIEFYAVADDWHPPVGTRRIAALATDTQQFEAVQP